MKSEVDFRIKISPAYLSEFHCIGASCKDTCCAGWNVFIDKSTYKKYKKIKDKFLSPLFEAHVQAVRGVDRSEGHFGKIRLDSNGRCPFLSQNLCAIQNKLGPSSLSKTCSQYPRVYRENDWVDSVALTPSCPEATRLMVENPRALELSIEKTMAPASKAMQNVDELNRLSVESRQVIHLSILQLLSEHEFPLWHRVSAIGMFCFILNRELQSDSENKVNSFVDNLCQPRVLSEFFDMTKDSAGDYAGQSLVFSRFINFGSLKGRSEFQQRVVADIEELQAAIANKEEHVANTRIYEKYVDGLKQLNSYLGNRPHVLSNVLENEILRTGFPFNERSVWSAFLILLSKFGILRFLLSIRASRTKESFNDDEVINVTSSFSRMYEHNARFAQNVDAAFASSLAQDYNLVAKLVRDDIGCSTAL
jgi:lysine-N-methylase